MKRQCILLALTIAAAAVATVTAPVDLTRRPVEGQEYKYELAVDFEIQGQYVAVSAEVVDKVTEVNDDDDYTIERTLSDMYVDEGGGEMPGGPEATLTTSYAKSGEVLMVESDQMLPEVVAIFQLVDFYAPTEPIEIGATWIHKIGAKEAAGLVATTYSYRLASVEDLKGRSAGKVKLEASQESNAAAKGFIWVDLETGAVLRIAAELTSVLIPGGGPVDLKMVLELDD